MEAAVPEQIAKELCLSVDCEFNRHLGLGKVHTIPDELVDIVEDAKRKAKPVSDDDSFYFFSVAPDIILHQRGIDDNNLLVVELKKDSNPEIPEYDNLKLKCFTEREPGYEYCVGAKVTARDQIEPEDRALEITAWYHEGVEISRTKFEPRDHGYCSTRCCRRRFYVLEEFAKADGVDRRPDRSWRCLRRR